MNKKSKLSVDELYEMLADNELIDYDPVLEAFTYYSGGRNWVDPEAIRRVLEELSPGGPKVTDEDLDILIQNADLDGDGKIGLEDFRALLTADAEVSAAEASASPDPEAQAEQDED